MPLKRECSAEAFDENMAELIASGKSPGQAAAIAYATLREACEKEGKEPPVDHDEALAMATLSVLLSDSDDW